MGMFLLSKVINDYTQIEPIVAESFILHRLPIAWIRYNPRLFEHRLLHEYDVASGG